MSGGTRAQLPPKRPLPPPSPAPRARGEPAHGSRAFDVATHSGAPALQRMGAEVEGGPLGVLVEDDAEPAAGQIRRAEFVTRAFEALERAAAEELARHGRSTEDCPWLAFYAEHYRDKSAAHLERVIVKYARPTATAPEALLEAIVARVREAIGRWAATGAVDAPEGAPGLAADAGGQPTAAVPAPAAAVEPDVLGFDGAIAARDPRGLRSALGAGRPLEGAARTRMERGFGRDFGAVRVHADAPAARAATTLSARAFTVGTDIAFGAGQYRPGTTRGDLMLAHELAHVVQQDGSRDEAAQAFATGNEGELETDADRAALRAVAANGAAPHELAHHTREVPAAQAARPGISGGLRLQRCGPSDEEVRWKQAVAEQFTSKLEEQPAGVEDQLKALELSAAATRLRAIDQKVIPAAVVTPWDKAVRLLFAAGPTLNQTGTLDQAQRDLLIATLAEFYRQFRKLVAPKDYTEATPSYKGTKTYWTRNRYLTEGALEGERYPAFTADTVGILERLRSASTRAQWHAVFADFRKTAVGMDRYIADELALHAKREQGVTLGATESKVDKAVTALAAAMKTGDPPATESSAARAALFEFSDQFRRAVAVNDYWYEPKAVKSTTPGYTNDYYTARSKELFDKQLAGAKSAEDWRIVIGTYQRYRQARQSFMLNPLARAPSDTGDKLVHDSGVVSGIYGLLERHPQAKRIPTVFYPKEESDRAVDADFTPHGYPIHLYLYWEGGTWYLVDFTNPDSVKTNEEDGSESSIPVDDLFDHLDSRHRFPEGMLYWQMPDGTQKQLETTAKRTVADWLRLIGITAAVVGLAFATGGASVAATGFFIASGVAGAGAALWTMLEKSEHGLLTTGDVIVGVASIAAELGNAATAGAGKLVMSGAGKTGTFAKLAVLADRLYIPTVKVTAGANLVSLIAISANDLAQIEALGTAKGSEEDKQRARERIVHQLLLMGGISILAMRGQIADYRGGRNLFFDPNFAPKGVARALLKDQELLERAALFGVTDDAAALIARTDLPEDLMLRLRAEISGALTTGRRDPQAIKDKLAALRAATSAEAVELALAELRKLNQQAYEKLLALMQHPEIAALLKKQPALRAGLEEHPKLIDLMANDDTLRSVLIKRPEAMASLLKHPAAIDVVERAMARAASARGAPKPPAAAQKLTTPLTQTQREVSVRISSAMPKARPKQPGFDVKRIKDPTYVDKYLDELYDKAKGAQDELTAISESVANATKGKPASRTDPKLRQRSMDKIRSNYDGDASRLTDLAGSKIIYETLDDLYNGLAKVEKELGGKIVYFEDRFLSPMESGYRDVQMNVRMANGHVAEFRLHLASIEAVSATEHAAYQVRRAVAPIAKEEGRAVSAAEKELEQALLDESQRLYEEALAKGMKAP